MACIRLLIHAVLLVGLLGTGLFFPSTAQAQSCSSASDGCDQGQAYSLCMSELKAYIATRERQGIEHRNDTCSPMAGQAFLSKFQYRVSDSDWADGEYRIYAWGGGTCASRLDGDAGMINGTLYSGGVCNQGCKMQPNLDPSTNFSMKEQGSASAISIRRGTWQASGDLCYADIPPQPPKKDEYCHKTSSGHTVCKSKDKTCVSTAGGFRTCASDTGNQKGHTQTNNQRTEAASISSPNTPPNPPTNRPGENWQQSGGTTNITNNNTGSTTNNTTYNNSGTPNGNQPVPGDGSGPGQGGSNGNGNEGEGEGEGNSASGGGDCKTPPVVTGDAALAMVATQAWATRCAVESGGGTKVTGNISDCTAAFSVQGDSPEAHQLRATRAAQCAGPDWAKAGEGQGSGGNPHDGAEGIDGPGKSIFKFDSDLLDTSGFGGGSCPQLGTIDLGRFGSFSMDSVSWWCSLIAGLRAVMLLMGAFISMRIVFGD